MFLQCTELGKLKTHGKYIEKFWDFVNVLRKVLNFYYLLTMYLLCVFNFPSSVHCKNMVSVRTDLANRPTELMLVSYDTWYTKLWGNCGSLQSGS